MFKTKKVIRAKFRNDVFTRDNFCCKICGAKYHEVGLDAHHITDRDSMPNGGYILENGISLCPECHFQAEMLDNSNSTRDEKYSSDNLYRLIGSSKELAIRKAKL